MSVERLAPANSAEEPAAGSAAPTKTFATIPVAGVRPSLVSGAARAEPQAALPDRANAEEAVRTLLAYFGEDPDREGLIDTPKRFVDAYEEFLTGYKEDPIDILGRTFEDVAGYDDIVLMKNISLESHCEHHIIPIIGTAHIAYLPSNRVVGISKLARVVDVFAKRLVSQETLTEQIADAIETALRPRGVAVLIDAQHYCISTRGVHKPDVACVTQRMIGVFKTDPAMEARFLRLIGQAV